MTPQSVQRQTTCRELLTQTLAATSCTLTSKHQPSVRQALPERFTQESVKLKPDEGRLVTLHHTGTCGHIRLKVTDGINTFW